MAEGCNISSFMTKVTSVHVIWETDGKKMHIIITKYEYKNIGLRERDFSFLFFFPRFTSPFELECSCMAGSPIPIWKVVPFVVYPTKDENDIRPISKRQCYGYTGKKKAASKFK